MAIKLRWLYILLVAGCLYGLVGGSAQAAPLASQVGQELPFATEDGGFNQPIDVVVVLDDSGSMATCWPWPRNGAQPFTPPCGGTSPNPPSDPDVLRYSAARLLLQLAAENDRVAVVRFDSGAEGIGELGTLQAMGPTNERRRLTDSLIPPTNYLPRGYTRIDLGLQAAIDLLAAAREPGRNQYVLLLTDGEPSGPQGFGGQETTLRTQIATLREAGVLVFPVVLCNPTAGCAGEFLTEELPELESRQATTPQELLRVFSEIFAAMKPDLSVITSRTGNAIQLTTREGHGVRRLAFVTARDGLTSIQRDDQPILPQGTLADPSIDVNLLEGETLAPGRWIGEMSDAGGFAVVQTDSYPQLLNPPPSLANSPASVRYYPSGRPVLLLARSGGPGVAEPLLIDGKTPLQPFAQTDFKLARLNNPPTTLSLQVGDDQAPLQLVRSFRLEGRSDLPHVEVFSPLTGQDGLLPNSNADLQVGFGGGIEVQNLAATVFVTDESNDDQGQGRLVYQAAMACDAQLCRDGNFTPADGRSYDIIYVVQAMKDGLRFSDWGEASLGLKPAVQLRGLPAEIDLAQMPPGGWPVELSSGTTEPIGSLRATIELHNLTTDEPAAGVALNFDYDVPETGVATATLNIQGLDLLRPGDYAGEITLHVTRPNGQPMDVAIRPGSTLPLSFKVARPMALVDMQLADFGDILFDTSPNFRLDQELLLPISFLGKQFRVNATLAENQCADLSLISGEMRTEGERLVLPIRLMSPGPVAPGACGGVIQLSGPDGDYDLFPAQLDWQVRVNDVEWSLVSGTLDLGDLQDAGNRVEMLLGVRFTGKTPFVLQMADLQVTGESPDGPLSLTAADLEMAPVEVSGAPNEAGIYEVPITLILRRDLPRDSLQGAFFTGGLTLQIVGLPNKAQTLALNFRNPSLMQRYVLPYVVPVYAQLPLALCAWPLTLFLLLVSVARLRSRGINDVEIDEASVATTMPIQAPPIPSAMSGGNNPPPAALDAVWGNADWGDAWGGSEAGERPASGSGYSASSTESGDAWGSSW